METDRSDRREAHLRRVGHVADSRQADLVRARIQPRRLLRSFRWHVSRSTSPHRQAQPRRQGESSSSRKPCPDTRQSFVTGQHGYLAAANFISSAKRKAHPSFLRIRLRLETGDQQFKHPGAIFCRKVEHCCRKVVDGRRHDASGLQTWPKHATSGSTAPRAALPFRPAVDSPHV